MSRISYCIVALGFAAPLTAQTVSFFYSTPSPASFTVSRNIQFGSADTATLRMDVYRPTAARAVHPTLVFYTAGAQRAYTGYTSWARIAASKAVVAILADLRPPAAAQDFRALLAHRSERGSAYGVDTAAIAVFGASSNA